MLALSRPGGLIVCNGYKDREYIRLALIGRKLGLQTFIVIEKPSELALVIEESRALGVKPGLGVRMRLATLGAGKWQNSGGDKAKFGLDPRQLLTLWKELRGPARHAGVHAIAIDFLDLQVLRTGEPVHVLAFGTDRADAATDRRRIAAAGAVGPGYV